LPGPDRPARPRAAPHRLRGRHAGDAPRGRGGGVHGGGARRSRGAGVPSPHRPGGLPAQGGGGRHRGLRAPPARASAAAPRRAARPEFRRALHPEGGLSHSRCRSGDDMKPTHISTLAVHAGRPAVRDPHGAHVAPLYQTSTFVFEDAEAGRRAFAGEAGGAGHLYTRLGNPTSDSLERALAALEGAGVEGEPAALVFASGMAAITTAVLAYARGGHVVAQEALYGCTSEFLAEQAPELGIEVTFVDASRTEAVEAALRARPDTRLVLLESPANPTLALADVRAVSALAHEIGAVVMVDNTFATPYHQRPLALGADLVAHSTTKYIGGHGTSIGGALVARDASLLGPAAVLRKNLGGVPGPFDSWLLLNGLKTFALRMERH